MSIVLLYLKSLMSDVLLSLQSLKSDLILSDLNHCLHHLNQTSTNDVWSSGTRNPPSMTYNPPFEVINEDDVITDDKMTSLQTKTTHLKTLKAF